MKKELIEKWRPEGLRPVFVAAVITSLIIAGTFLPARAQGGNLTLIREVKESQIPDAIVGGWFAAGQYRRRSRRKRYRKARIHANNRGAKKSINGMEKVSVGMWGGEHIGLQVADSSARVEYDCAHGTIDEPLSLDAHGDFKVKGVHIREHGGPERQGERSDSHPARYVGKVDGHTMTLTVTLTDTNETIGTFTLTFGRDPLVRKCL